MRVVKWIIPVMAIVLQPVIFFYAMGLEIDIRRVVVFIVGALLIVTGNFLPKVDRLNGINTSPDKARKINRFIGYATVVMGGGCAVAALPAHRIFPAAIRRSVPP